MDLLRDNVKTPLRGIPVAFHFFIFKAAVAKYHRVCSKPSFGVIYVQLIVGFINDDVDRTDRKDFRISDRSSFFCFSWNFIDSNQMRVRGEYNASQEQGREQEYFHKLYSLDRHPNERSLSAFYFSCGNL